MTFSLLAAVVVVLAFVAGSRSGQPPLWAMEMGPTLDLVLVLTTMVLIAVRSLLSPAVAEGSGPGSGGAAGFALGLLWAAAGFCFALNTGDAVVMVPYAVFGLVFAATYRRSRSTSDSTSS